MNAPRRLAALILAVMLLAGSAPAQTGAETELPIPRFVSLRADRVNLRTGPGTRYPVEWIFVQRGLPVEVVAEYDQWRRIRDIDGSDGWVHQSLLSGRRTVIVTGEERTLIRAPGGDERAVVRAEPGVLGELLACEGDWCRLEIAGYKGWLKRTHIFGVYPEEPFP